MNSSRRLIRSFVVIIQRRNSEARRIIRVFNPTGRNHKKSARSETKITESMVTFSGHLTKKINIKQKRKSGSSLDVGFKLSGANDIITSIVPKTIKEAVVSNDL